MPRGKYRYSIGSAQNIAQRLLRASPAVQAAFLAWQSAGTPPDLCVAGYTVERLTREHGMRPVAALLTLDWLAREPERAAASLRKGHDWVISHVHR